MTKDTKVTIKVRKDLQQNTLETDLDGIISKYREDNSYLIADTIIQKTKEWLGEPGKDFFSRMKKEHGSYSPVYSLDCGNGVMIPHSVHFNEGMQVRNFLRSLDETKDWTDVEAFDNLWEVVIEKALEE